MRKKHSLRLRTSLAAFALGELIGWGVELGRALLRAQPVEWGLAALSITVAAVILAVATYSGYTHRFGKRSEWWKSQAPP